MRCRTMIALAILTVILMPMSSAPYVHDTAPADRFIDADVDDNGLHVLNGDGAHGLVDEYLPSPLKFKLVENGAPSAGRNITITLESGPSGSYLESGARKGNKVIVETGANGRASASLFMGAETGTISIQAKWGNWLTALECYTITLFADLKVHGEFIVGGDIVFDGSGSTGNITGYVYRFSDDILSPPTLQSTVIHSYSRPGNHRVELTVLGPNGLEMTDTKVITISDKAEGDDDSPYLVYMIEITAFLVIFGFSYYISHTMLLEEMRKLHKPGLRDREDNYDMAISHAITGEKEKAIAYFKKVIKKDPKNAHAYFYMGIVLMEQTKYKEARQALNRAIKIQPQFQEAKKALHTLNQFFKARESI